MAICHSTGIPRARARLFEITAQRKALDRIFGNACRDCLQAAGNCARDSRDPWRAIAILGQDATGQEIDCSQRTKGNGWSPHDVWDVKRIPFAVWLERPFRAAKYGRLPGSRRRLRTRRQEAGAVGRRKW